MYTALNYKKSLTSSSNVSIMNVIHYYSLSISFSGVAILLYYIFSFSGKVFTARKEAGVLRKTLIEMNSVKSLMESREWRMKAGTPQ
jgi:hypothetical protein